MATSNMRGIKYASGMIDYCEDPQIEKGKTERVKFEYSTFVDEAAERRLFRGQKYDGYHFRVSFDPQDRKLTEEEFNAISSELAERYLGSRPYKAVLHADTDHEHIHFISPFLDAEGKFINTKAGDKEAIRRQSIVDDVCRKHNLSTLPRSEKGFNSRDRGAPGYKTKAEERWTKAEKNGKQPWRTETKKHLRECGSIEDLERRGVQIVREGGESLTLEYQGKKMRLNRLLPQLKNRADLERHIRERINKKQTSIDRLRRSEQLLINRLSRTVEALTYQGYNRTEIQGIAEKVLQHRATTNDPGARWEALKIMRTELNQIMTKEQLKALKTHMYREKQQRYQSRTLRKALRSRNPIVAFVTSLNVILNALMSAIKNGNGNGDGNGSNGGNGGGRPPLDIINHKPQQPIIPGTSGPGL